jgi:hypothetical protein
VVQVVEQLTDAPPGEHAQYFEALTEKPESPFAVLVAVLCMPVKSVELPETDPYWAPAKAAAVRRMYEL